MRAVQRFILVLAVLGLAPAARAGITVTEYSTAALTNGWAPTSGAQYYAKQQLFNVSPALASVSGDWMGPNFGGGANTWHFAGTSQSSSTTTIDATSYTVTATGSFQYQIDTTADFIDPRGASVLTPSGVANYDGLFDVDTEASYSVTAILNRRGRVRLNNLQGAVIFDRSNLTDTPMSINLSGTIPAGQYRVLATASLGAGNLPNGVNDYARSGSFQDFSFAVQVPEPDTVAGLVVVALGSVARCRGRCISDA